MHIKRYSLAQKTMCRLEKIGDVFSLSFLFCHFTPVNAMSLPVYQFINQQINTLLYIGGRRKSLKRVGIFFKFKI